MDVFLVASNLVGTKMLGPTFFEVDGTSFSSLSSSVEDGRSRWCSRSSGDACQPAPSKASASAEYSEQLGLAFKQPNCEEAAVLFTSLLSFNTVL